MVMFFRTMGSLANIAVVTLDSPSRSAACEQAAHFNLIRIVRLFSKVVGIALDFYGREQGGDRRRGCVNEIERYRIGCSSGV